MSDNWNDHTAPHQPGPPQYAQDPTGAAPPASAPTADVMPPTAPIRPPADETAWVRSIYLFGACATGGILMIIGALLAIGSAVAIVTPDSGLRDGWDRGLVGTTQVVDEGLDVFDEFTQIQLEDDFDRFCDNNPGDAFCDDLADRIEDQVSAVPDELTDNIGLIRDEVHRQIRVSAFAELIGGLGLAIVGLLLFRFHSKRVSIYARA